MATETKTFRLAKSMCDQLAREAEKRNATAADVVRQATDYFQRKQLEASLLAIEQRIITRVDLNARMLADGIKEILDLAVRINSSKSSELKSRLGSCPYAPVA